MKRRKFIHRLLGCGAAILLGAARLASKGIPRVFRRAERCGKYPGGFRPPNDIFSQGKWGG
ncbi:MAG: hypothetical protein ACYS8Z_10815 [Planctomycetota bacterium]|jgi:hypothetical protein